MTSVRLVVDEIKANDISNGIGDDGAPFELGGDEIYFFSTGGGGTGDVVGDHLGNFDFDEGDVKKNIELAQVEVGNGDAAGFNVFIGESDFGWGKIFQGITGLAQGVGSVINGVKKDLDLEKIGKGAQQIADSGTQIYNTIQEGDDDSIGLFGFTAVNEGGQFNFAWSPGKDADTTLLTPEEANFAIFNATGGGANYTLRVRASLVGSQSADLISGNNRGDLIDGGDGNDTLQGEEGNDTLEGSGAQDWLYGGQDNDILNGGQGDDRLFGEEGQDTLQGESGQDSLHGGQNNDLLNGGNGDDRLFGEQGNDVLAGGQGQDRLWGGSDNDLLEGEGEEDWLYGEAGDDTLLGGSDVCRDVLFGGEGDDLLNSGLGDDYLNGEAGFNTLMGGGGYDTFVVTSPGYAIVTDFEVGVDRIVLEGLDPADLQFMNSGGSVSIGNGTNSFAQLNGVQQGDLSDEDFLKLITRS